MLTKKQIQFLKKEAHALKPIFQVGKGGINDDMIKQIFQAVNKRELIKVSLLQNTDVEPEKLARVLQNELHVTVVQIIGHTLVIYYRSEVEKYRNISERIKKVK